MIEVWIAHYRGIRGSETVITGLVLGMNNRETLILVAQISVESRSGAVF